MTGQRIKLAEEPPFDLGTLHVEPARREISATGSGPIKLEPRVMQVLVALAQHSGKVMSRDELVETCWAGVSVSDDAVNRVVSILRRDLGLAGDHGVSVDTVTKVGYRLRVYGEPRVDTGPGESQASEPGGGKRARKRLAGMLPLAALAVAGAVMLGLLVAGVIGSRVAAAPDFNLVAVDEFAGGETPGEGKLLRDALLRELAQAGIVSVPATGEGDAPLRVVGTFSRIDGHRAVTVRVEDRATGEALWSDSFDLTEDLQRQLGHFVPWAVGNAIACGVSGNSPQSPISDTKLVGYFIRSCNEFRYGYEYETLLVQSRRALAYAPGDVVAQLRYAIAAGWTAKTESERAERKRLVSSARQIANAVLADAPQLGLAYYARAIAEWSDGNWVQAEEDLRQAKVLAPEYPFTDNALTSIAASLGYADQAFDLRRQAVVSDHFSLIQQARLAEMMGQRGMLPEAYGAIEKIAQINPGMACEARFEVDFWIGDPRAARRSLESGCNQGVLSAAQTECAEGFLDYRLGRARADQVMPACRVFPARLATRFAVALGMPDEAATIALTRPAETQDPAFLFAPPMLPLQRDPRILEIAHRFGVLEAWAQTDRWPDFCKNPAIGYDCREVAARVMAQRS